VQSQDAYQLAGAAAERPSKSTLTLTSTAAPVIPAPRRVLVREVNWLGDLVISRPALRAIRRAWPDAHLAVLVTRDLAGFFDGARWIDEVISYTRSRGLRSATDAARIAARIRAGSFDLAILFPNSFSSALWMVLAGVRNRAGYAIDGRGPLLTHKLAPPADALTGHQMHYWLAMLRATLGIDTDADAIVPGASPEATIDVHEPHRAAMRAWLAARRQHPDRPLIALAPAAAFGPAKEWPAERYSALIDLMGEREAECVLVGAPAERPRCEAVARGSRSGALVAAGETGIGELIALLSLCDGFAGNDSGSMHLAAALNLPTVAVFGSTNPNRTGPLGARIAVLYRALECSPCLARTCRFGHYHCLTSIEPAEVVSALENLGALSRIASE
jgi:heptosyltransferase II